MVWAPIVPSMGSRCSGFCQFLKYTVLLPAALSPKVHSSLTSLGQILSHFHSLSPMHLFFMAILYSSGNSSINISTTSKSHKAENHVPLCSPLDPQNLVQCLAESRCHRKNKGREEVGHSTSPLHSSKMKFPILCLTSEKNQIRYVRRNFPTYGRLVGGCICRNVLTVNIKPPPSPAPLPAPMLSIEEDSHRASERATIKRRKQNLLYIKGSGEMSDKHANCRPQPRDPFQPQHVPRPEAKTHERRVPRDPSFLFPYIWASGEHILSETTLRVRHSPYSPFP